MKGGKEGGRGKGGGERPIRIGVKGGKASERTEWGEEGEAAGKLLHCDCIVILSFYQHSSF